MKHPTANNKKKTDNHFPLDKQFVQQSISVPLHAPVFLKEYGTVDPSFPERILSMTEKEQVHQHQKENRELKMQEKKLLHTIFEVYLGVFVAAVIALSFCYGGIHVILEGYPYTGLTVLGGVIVALVLAFIQGRKS